MEALVQELAVISFSPAPVVRMAPRLTTELHFRGLRGRSPLRQRSGSRRNLWRAGLSAFALQELHGADGREPRMQETSYARRVAGGDACDYQGPTGEMG
jgi:hypothetical protein